jgi:hypothetical protein
MSDKSKGMASDVDRPFLPERKGQVKDAFDRVGKAHTQNEAKDSARESGSQGKAPGSASLNAPAMSLDMPGGGPIKQSYSAERMSKEAATMKLKQDAAKIAAKKMEKSGGKEHNFGKGQNIKEDKGRE